jgi:dihydropteroate synthase
MKWHIRERILDLSQRPLVMGIVNVTPDSFSDGGLYRETAAAIAHGRKLVAEGADILDIGGESSRPGSLPVTLEEELSRVIPVVRGLASESDVSISVDTTKAEVARQAIAAGAAIINDITALRGDPAMATAIREAGAGVCLMHMQGTPETMQENPMYADVATDVRDFLAERIAFARQAGIAESQIVVDPGIGFGKTVEHNYDLLRRLAALNALGRPILLGVSRKGFIGMATGRPRPDRAAGSLAIACYCTTRGAAHLWRVHDVPPHLDAAKMLAAMGGY